MARATSGFGRFDELGSIDFTSETLQVSLHTNPHPNNLIVNNCAPDYRSGDAIIWHRGASEGSSIVLDMESHRVNRYTSAGNVLTAAEATDIAHTVIGRDRILSIFGLRYSDISTDTDHRYAVYPGHDDAPTGQGDPLADVYGLAQRTYEETLAAIDDALEG